MAGDMEEERWRKSRLQTASWFPPPNSSLSSSYNPIHHSSSSLSSLPDSSQTGYESSYQHAQQNLTGTAPASSEQFSSIDTAHSHFSFYRPSSSSFDAACSSGPWDEFESAKAEQAGVLQFDMPLTHNASSFGFLDEIPQRQSNSFNFAPSEANNSTLNTNFGYTGANKSMGPSASAAEAITDEDRWFLEQSAALKNLNSSAAKQLAEAFTVNAAPTMPVDAFVEMSSPSNASSCPSPKLEIIGDSQGVYLPFDESLNVVATKKQARSKRGQYTSNPCAECRMKKRKCTSTRPCAMCIASGNASKCVSSDSVGKSFVERIISGCREVRFEHDDRMISTLMSLKSAAERTGVNFALLRIMWELGHDPSALIQAFKMLPTDVKSAIDESVDTMQSVVRMKLSAMNLHTDLNVVRDQQNLGRVNLFQMRSKQAGSIKDDEFCDGRWGHGRWITMFVDPDTLMRTGFKLGNEICELFGYHPEEFVARQCNNELNLLMSEYDLLWALLNNLLNVLHPTVTWYWRIAKRNATSEHDAILFLKVTVEKHFDSLNRQVAFTVLFDPVDEAEFSNFMSKVPGMDDHSQSSMADHMKDVQCRGKIAYLRRSRTNGCQKLSALASGLRERVAPLVGMLHPSDPNKNVQEELSRVPEDTPKTLKYSAWKS
ncbi:hypothetical protein GUITHDRAFT_118869 [Guillardia theta CCMP2712]|uniref:Zn(2)-C6 fungal-type domain-containing protein n=2 Tax=Guillardia theta TaxID=55529 RepID=L1IGH6_GUITC|nr:hypothetical protein GUITHDRAFT_118869 [Guillardia theta CCMP2712]EKX34935.1 hypothetical protein GUITHDRAFT_118869 [Guillardia theta CCMP2712]|eukprot:XP_005821915.1 hypothetical protein GUITHDRAFT_118869 [Guillardia theta CCMP2712]